MRKKSGRDWKDVEVERLAGFRWEMVEPLKRALAAIDDKDSWTDIKTLVIDHQTPVAAFEVIRQRGAEAAMYNDGEAEAWRQDAITRLEDSDPVLAIFAADAINQMLDKDTFAGVVRLLIEVFSEDVADPGQQSGPSYLIDREDFEYLPRYLRNEMPAHIKELLEWRGEFARIESLRDLENLRALKSRFPHCDDLIETMSRQVEASWQLGSDVIQIRPILLVGDAGVGKTKIAREICKSLGLHIQEANVGGSSESHLFGLSAGWHSAHAGIVTEAVATSRTLNPCVVLDEIDKVHASRNGDIQGELLGLLEPSEARRYFERYLKTTVDASRVSWILTANDIENVSAPLRSRCTVIEVPKPNDDQIPAIIKSMVADLASENGLRREFFQLGQDEVEALMMAYRQHRSVRILGRNVASFLHFKSMHLPRA